MSDRYRKYIVEYEIGGKKFRGILTAFNEDNVKLKVRQAITFTRIEEHHEPESKPFEERPFNSTHFKDTPFGDIFNQFFGK